MAQWTRQHFKLVAETVDQHVQDEGEKRRLCNAFDREFEDKNPRYDSDRFMFACGGF